MPAHSAPSLLLVGINGYGTNYVNALLELRGQGGARLAGIVDPTAARCARLAELTEQGAPVHDRIEDFLAAGGRADLAVIASPIQFHCEQTCAALEAGIPVLCEKPLGARIEEADRMEAAERRSGKFVAIGYQWSFSRAVLTLKADILNGRLGAPRRLKTMVLWPRGSHYYARNNWAGRIQDDAGRWVLDSPVNNATAHYLHNMLYLLGDRLETSVRLAELTAELYRANPIENFDTCAMRLRTAAGVEILFYTTHTTRRQVNPTFELEFERGTVRYEAAGEGAQIVATFADGSVCHYGDPSGEQRAKLTACLAALRDPSRTIVCGVAAARAQTLCVDALRGLPIRVFEPGQLERHTRENGDTVTYVPGLAEMLLDAYADNRLPSERRAPLATPAVTVAF